MEPFIDLLDGGFFNFRVVNQDEIVLLFIIVLLIKLSVFLKDNNSLLDFLSRLTLFNSFLELVHLILVEELLQLTSFGPTSYKELKLTNNLVLLLNDFIVKS